MTDQSLDNLNKYSDILKNTKIPPNIVLDSEGVLEGYHQKNILPLLSHSKRLSQSKIGPSILPVEKTTFEAVFGKDHADHAFRHQWEWGFWLREPDITKTFEKLLNVSSPCLRAERIHAFLSALNIPDIPDESVLEDCKVFAEKDRIDLQIWIPSQNNEGKYRPVVIEAKLESHIREGFKGKAGQLSKYRQIINKNRALINDEADYILLCQTTKAAKGLKGRQHAIWNTVLWSDFWIQFEKKRPKKDNYQQIAFFMNALFSRTQG